MEFEPDLKALLIIDMQADALPPSQPAVPDMDAVVEGANRAVTACRNAGVPVIFTRYHQRRTFLGLSSSSAMGATPDSEDRGELCPLLDYDPARDQMLLKQRWSAFAYTDLDLRLSVLPGSQIALAGVVTDASVLETAYDAFDRQLRVVLIEDAIGACTEGAHKSAMLGMADWLYECRITVSDAFANWLDGAPYEGWTWTYAHEFPYTSDSLATEYDRLARQAGTSVRRILPRATAMQTDSTALNINQDLG
jgi:nicotinamidase-related amidase